MCLLFPDELSPGNSGREGHKATRHLPSTPLYITLKEFRVTVKFDTSLSPTGSNVFADRGSVVTAQVRALQGRESLTKRLFEHWLNISQSYKKQHGGNKRGSRNQILYTAGTFFFSPCRLVDFSPLCPCRLTALVRFTKTSVTQMRTTGTTSTTKPLSPKKSMSKSLDQFASAFWAVKKNRGYFIFQHFREFEPHQAPTKWFLFHTMLGWKLNQPFRILQHPLTLACTTNYIPFSPAQRSSLTSMKQEQKSNAVHYLQSCGAVAASIVHSFAKAFIFQQLSANACSQT